MSSHDDGTITRLFGWVKALLPGDWWSEAGTRFRSTTQLISNFGEEHNVQPSELLGEGIELDVKKLDGSTSHEFGTAVETFRESERIKIEAELHRRSLESKVRKEEAEARVAELVALDAEVELLRKLRELRVLLHRDGRGNLTVLPSQSACDLDELIERRVKEYSTGSTHLGRDPQRS